MKAHRLGTYELFFVCVINEKLAERSNAPDCKSGDSKGSVGGSNPSLFTKIKRDVVTYGS